MYVGFVHFPAATKNSNLDGKIWREKTWSNPGQFFLAARDYAETYKKVKPHASLQAFLLPKRWPGSLSVPKTHITMC